MEHVAAAKAAHTLTVCEVFLADGALSCLVVVHGRRILADIRRGHGRRGRSMVVEGLRGRCVQPLPRQCLHYCGEFRLCYCERVEGKTRVIGHPLEVYRLVN